MADIAKIVPHLSRRDLASALEYSKTLPYVARRKYFREVIKVDLVGETDITNPQWLIDGTNFFTDVWSCKFGDRSSVKFTTIDFRITIHDGSLLTDARNAPLLTIIKYLICVQVHPRFNGGQKFGSYYSIRIITFALNFIDWVLINGKKLNIGQSGMGLLSKNDIKNYFVNHIASPMSESLYNFNSRLSQWLINKTKQFSDEQIASVMVDKPWVTEIPDDSDRVLSLSDEQLCRAKAAIFLRGDYYKRNGSWTFNTQAFIAEEYANTLHGCHMAAAMPPELQSGHLNRHEYPRVPVAGWDGGNDLFDRTVRHLGAVKKLAAVDHFYYKVGFNVQIITNLSVANLIEDSDNGVDGRFLSLPAEVPFKAIRTAAEALFEKVDLVFGAMTQMCSAKIHTPSKPNKRYLKQYNDVFKKIVTPELSSLGVNCWSISYGTLVGRESNFYYGKLRGFEGLFEAYETVYGLMLILIGGLTARRQAEIKKLKSGHCLLPNTNPWLEENALTLYSLRFPGGKTGHADERQILSIPITSLIAKAIWKLQEFNEKFVELKLLKPGGPLFFSIARLLLETYKFTEKEYNHYLDVACDYSETAVVTLEDGLERRFYIRQHQLRRFLAMAFFWSAGFDGLETLRYYLGHVDVRHLYRYVTECLSGEVLRTVKVDKIVDSIINGKDDLVNIEIVKSYLSKKFGCADVIVMSENGMVEEYGYLLDNGLITTDVPIATVGEKRRIHDEITALMTSHKLKLEPEFLSYGSDGESNRLGFHLVLKLEFL
ncbi:hypothetical protein [Pseudomonas siliginis]|uniref:hypothetical protein n=1 Tax=Pseudomonas siliginis TaxID=2842346 RepID=UPI00209360EB|nr:hypothetical protein [Pseudomonas siliginis]UST92762.1 hypothetical protein NF678_12845 [Pseudomonas siliginis]